MTLLETKAVDYYYQDGDQRRYILKETSVSFEKGRFYAILGQSGSGKTTFLSLISALDSPKSGQVLYEGTDIEKIGHENYRRDDISIIFQSYNLIPYLSAVENVLVPMAITKNQLPDNQREVAYNLLDYIEKAGCEGAYIGLMAMPGTEAFYEKFGFIERPNPKFGSGMICIDRRK